MPNCRKTLRSIPLWFLWLLVPLLIACQGETPGVQTPQDTPGRTPTVQVSASASPQPPTPSPTPRVERTLVVCLGQEPDSLYPYGTRMEAAQSVLDAIYDGPIDRVSYAHQPVILQKLPQLADGDAVVRPGPVQAGDQVVDGRGNLITLGPGSVVRPSGCQAGDCALVYDGQSPLEMDQMIVDFALLPGLAWSDGAPLTAQDSVYSFNLAAAPETPSSKFKIDRTASYQAVDELTVRWTGVPGYIDPTYFTNLWTPYPEHLWSLYSPAELLSVEETTRRPVGYGPYVVEEWLPGNFIRLRWNENYTRLSDGWPRFENLVYRFVGQDSAANIDQLLSGECDILDRTTRLEDRSERLLALEAEGSLNFEFTPNLDWEHLAFGIVPASYDDGFNLVFDRPDFLGDLRTRQAIAYCADRERIHQEVFQGLTEAPDAFVPVGHPATNPAALRYAYRPEQGIALLEEVGWLDSDDDPATPRTAQGVPGVPPGTPFEITYLTTQAPQRVRGAEILADSLAGCGIQVNIENMAPGEVYSPGPEGLVFGRNFDLAQLAWQLDGEPACFLYLSEAIPGDPAEVTETGERRFLYGWGGWNPTGYRNPEFDRACRDARWSLPETSGYQENHNRAQEIFAADLPALPLYMHLNLGATRPDLCNFIMDPTTSSDLWNVEAIDYGQGCP